MKQETKETSIFVRFLVYVTGFLIMTLGIAISVKSDLGVSPVSSIPYTLPCRSLFYTVSGDASLTAVLDLLTEKGISGVPVVDGDQSLIGFISDGDILRFLAAEHPLYVNPSSLMTMDFDEKLQELMHCKVRDVARKSVITVNLSDDLGTVCHVLSDHHIKKAPILDDGDMVGGHQRQQYHQVRIPEAGGDPLGPAESPSLTVRLSKISKSAKKKAEHRAQHTVKLPQLSFFISFYAFFFRVSDSSTRVPASYSFRQRALARSMRFAPIIRGSNPAALKISVGFFPARYSHIK